MIYLLHGNAQHYAWGGYDYIPQLLGQAATEQPVAELWFGDHHQAPAQIEIAAGQRQALNDWLADNAEQVLSAQSIARFGRCLPFLLKILDVRLPLSIQLHPNKQQAEQGFAVENAQGIALSDPKRNYKDDNHKPESMIALSPFWLLHGFAEETLIIERLTARPSLVPLAKWIRDMGLEAAYARIMQASQEELSVWLAPLLAQEAPKQVSDNPDYWLHYTVQAMNISPQALDAGLLCFYLFNIVQLQTGEGIFQAAQLPHAYLCGQNVELMAASDNVLRAGLTPKHMDLAELLRIIDAKPITPQKIPAPNQTFYHYPAPVEDYTLYHLTLAAGESFDLACPEASIILVMSGELAVQENTQKLSIHTAEAVLASCNSHLHFTAQTAVSLVIASNQ